MEPASVALLDEQRNDTSPPGSPRHPSILFGSPASSPPPPDSPYVTLHDFSQVQQEALSFLEPSPDFVVRPLRCKSSRRHLFDDSSPAKTLGASNRQLPRLPSLHSRDLVPPPLIPHPLTPQQHPSATSPSLSSTITTLQSTPTQTPVSRPGLELSSSNRAADRVPFEPLRAKRKFPELKLPKRLPRQADDGGWLVLANVIGNSEASKQSQVQSVCLPERPRGGLAASARRPQTEGVIAKRDRSVRFAGLWSEGDEGDNPAGEGKGHEENTTGDSSYTLSKFKFPTPPGYAWSGTFGHLSEPTPPTSPATLHYRGASFDLVNPRASLLLGSKVIETPAEIDGLLDNYFDVSQDSLNMNYDRITGESIERSGSTPSSDDGSRRGRTLYTDISSARSKIMRLPSAAGAQLHGGLGDQVSPLAHRSPPVSRPTLVMAGSRAVEEGLSADYTAESNGHVLSSSQEPVHVGKQSRSRSRGGSTLGQAPSTYSDPFDLHISDDEFEQPNELERFDNIDRMVQSGRPRGAHVLANEGGLAGRDAGADAEAHVFHAERDTTIMNIVDHYGYRSAQGVQDESTSSISIEQGRATNGAQRRSILMSNNPFLPARERHTVEVSQRLRPPPGSPPVAPAPVPTSHIARHGFHLDNTDLPTSDQTYGATGELLGLTPAQDQRGTVGIGGRARQEAAAPHDIPRWDDDKENVPPLDESEDLRAAQDVHDNGHDGATFRPPVRNYRPGTGHRTWETNFRGIPRSIEIFEDDAPTENATRVRGEDRPASNAAPQAHGSGITAADTESQRLDSGFDLRQHAGTPPSSRMRIRDRDELDAQHRHAMERYESRRTVEDESAWEDDDEGDEGPFSRRTSHSQYTYDPMNRFSQATQATQGSYADVSDYEDSRRGSFAPMPPPEVEDLNSSRLPPGRPRRTAWIQHRLGIRMPFSDPAPPPDPADEHELKEMAKDTMRMKWNVSHLTGANQNVDRETMRQDEARLERIRQLSKSAVRLAAQEVAAEAGEAQILQTPVPRVPTAFLPIHGDADSFRQVMEAAQQHDDDMPGSSDSRRRLLSDNKTPQRPPGQLAWSETQHTFTTIRDPNSPIPWLASSNSGPYSPLPDPPEPAFTRAGAGTEDTIHTRGYGYDEHTPLTRSKGKQRAAVTGQTRMRPFLAAVDDPAAFNPGHRLTDAELARRVKFWLPRPMLDLPASASVEEGRRLLSVQQAYSPEVVRQQKAISRRMWHWCSLTPITALMFGFGLFDGLVANKMDGKVTGACPEEKHAALVQGAPLSFVCWALVVVAVAMAGLFVKTARAV